MKIAIIEDEELAVERLEILLMRIQKHVSNRYQDIEIVAKLESVADSVAFFEQQPMPDVVLSDI
ncbi:MAG: hypothetical protein RL757_2032, partial [Bacteroidota bacterium]